MSLLRQSRRGVFEDHPNAVPAALPPPRVRLMVQFNLLVHEARPKLPLWWLTESPLVLRVPDHRHTVDFPPTEVLKLPGPAR